MARPQGTFECPIELDDSDDEISLAADAPISHQNSSSTMHDLIRERRQRQQASAGNAQSNNSQPRSGISSRSTPRTIPSSKQTSALSQPSTPAQDGVTTGHNQSDGSLQNGAFYHDKAPATGAFHDLAQPPKALEQLGKKGQPENARNSEARRPSIGPSEPATHPTQSNRMGKASSSNGQLPSPIPQNSLLSSTRRNNSKDPGNKATLGTRNRSLHTVSEEITTCLRKNLVKLHKRQADSVKAVLTRTGDVLKHTTYQSRSTAAKDPFNEISLTDSRRPLKITQFNSNTPKVPYYHEYERVKNNRLAENRMKHLYIPDTGNDEQKKELYGIMTTECNMINLERPFDVLNDDQHRFYGSTITAFLDEIGVNWESVLFCFLEERERARDILAADLDHNSVEDLLLALDQEKNDTQIQFELSRKKWATLLEKRLRMLEPAANRLSRSILVLKHFHAERELSLWHFARRSNVATKLLRDVLPKANTECPTQDEPISYSKVTCPICKFSIANCPHGEIREIGEEALETAHDDSQMTEETDYDSSDIEIEKSINYRYPIIGAQVRPGSTKSKPRKFAINPPNNERRRPFQPCSHAGSCKSKQCSCYRAKVHCEKICGCSSTCSRRYRGCSCKTRGNAVCSNGDRSNCECIEISRECDADLCGSCGAADVLDPAHIYDDTVLGHRCNNVNLQRSVHKKTHVIDSKVHGFGLIAGEDFATGEFVGEYRGDIITKSEADRRGYVYHYEPTEYLFRLYEDPEDDDLEVAATKQELDGSRAGSKTRFINSAPEPRDKNANCSFKLLLCNTVLRVGVFATSDIQKGEEFLLDYGPSFFEPQSPAQARQPGPLDAVGMAMESAHEPNLVNEEEPVVTQELASIEEESLPPEETVSVDEQAPTKEPLPTEETGSLSEPAVVEEPLPSIEPNLIPPSSLRRSLSSASLGPISNEPIIPFSNVPRFKRLKIADSEYRRKATPDLLLVIPTELQQHVEPMSLSPVVPRISVSRGSARKSTGSTSASDGTRRPRTESTTTGSVAVSSIEESSASMESPPKRRIEGTDAALTLKRVKTAPTPILQNALKSPSAAGVNQQTKLGSSKTQADGQGTENLAGETPVEDLARQKLQSPIQKNGSKKTHSMPPRVSSPQTPIPVMGRSNTTPSLAQPSRFQRPESTESLTADLQKKISAARSPSAVARKSASTFPPPGTSMPASKASTHPVHDTASHNAPSGTPLNKSALTRGLSSTTTTSSASIPTTPSTKQNVNQSSTKAANSNKLGLWVARKSISSPAAQRPPGPSKAARKSSTPIVPQMIVISSDEERDAQGGAEGSKEKTPNDDDDNEETPDSDSDSDEDEGEDDGNDNNMDDDDNGEGGAGRGGGVGRTPSARLTQTHRPPDTETTL